MIAICSTPARASGVTTRGPSAHHRRAATASLVFVRPELDASPAAARHTAADTRQPRPRGASLVTRSIPVSGPQNTGDASGGCGGESGGVDGQVTSELLATMKAKIGEALETDQVDISDAYGDGRHVSIDVVSDAFEGKNSMQRQRMVYKAIWLELQDTVHAVDAMKTKTPEEAVTEKLF